MVTGGTGALGSAILEALIEQGADCHATAVAREHIAHSPWADHPRVRWHSLDLGDEAAVEHLYREEIPEPIDASIHTVGTFTAAPLIETSLEALQRLIDTNVTTTFLCCREAARRMIEQPEGGRIVNVAARPALLPVPGLAAYSAAKAAVISLTASLATELLPKSVLVNAIVPSMFDTPANRAAFPGEDPSTWPTAREIAEAILFLAGPSNRLTSGVSLPVYGRK